MPFDVSQVDTDPVVLALVWARARIENPKNWTADGHGNYEPGVNFCAVLAIDSGWKGSADAQDWLSAAAKELFDMYPLVVNDKLGHAAVMQVYDKAIETARTAALAKASTP